MAAGVSAGRLERVAGWQRLALLGVGFLAAVLLRVSVGGADVAQSAAAGLVFAAVLVTLTAIAREPVALRRPQALRVRDLAIGVGGAAVLCVPAVAGRVMADVPMHPRPWSMFGTWAAVVTVVAVAEEAFLRGALFRALETVAGPGLAIAGTAVAFALLHLPLYGWGALPLDLAVGIWLGALRQVTGSWLAPAVAHVLADFGGWWLV